MERSQLQNEWSQHRLDARTSYSTSVGTYQARSALDAALRSGAGAGAPSRVVAPVAAREAGEAGERSHRAAGASRNVEAVDWAGNLVRPSNRGGVSGKNAADSSIAVEGGFIVPLARGGGDPRDHRDVRARAGQASQLASSDGVRQSCPGAVDASQWTSSYQASIGGAGPGSALTAEAPKSNSKSKWPSMKKQAPAAQQQQQQARGVPRKQRPSMVDSKGDLVTSFDALAIAKSLKSSGAFKGPGSQSQSQSKGKSGSDGRHEEDDTLILDNYQRQLPGCTLHQPRHSTRRF